MCGNFNLLIVCACVIYAIVRLEHRLSSQSFDFLIFCFMACLIKYRSDRFISQNLLWQKDQNKILFAEIAVKQLNGLSDDLLIVWDGSTDRWCSYQRNILSLQPFHETMPVLVRNLYRFFPPNRINYQSLRLVSGNITWTEWWTDLAHWWLIYLLRLLLSL